MYWRASLTFDRVMCLLCCARPRIMEIWVSYRGAIVLTMVRLRLQLLRANCGRLISRGDRWVFISFIGFGLIVFTVGSVHFIAGRKLNCYSVTWYHAILGFLILSQDSHLISMLNLKHLLLFPFLLSLLPILFPFFGFSNNFLTLFGFTSNGYHLLYKFHLFLP